MKLAHSTDYLSIICKESNRTYFIREEVKPLFVGVSEGSASRNNNRRMELSDYVIENGKLIKSRT